MLIKSSTDKQCWKYTPILYKRFKISNYHWKNGRRVMWNLKLILTNYWKEIEEC